MVVEVIPSNGSKSLSVSIYTEYFITSTIYNIWSIKYKFEIIINIDGAFRTSQRLSRQLGRKSVKESLEIFTNKLNSLEHIIYYSGISFINNSTYKPHNILMFIIHEVCMVVWFECELPWQSRVWASDWYKHIVVSIYLAAKIRKIRTVSLSHKTTQQFQKILTR